MSTVLTAVRMPTEPILRLPCGAVLAWTKKPIVFAEVRPLEKLLSVYVDNVMLLPHDGRDMTVISDRRADKRGLPFDVESVLFEK